MASNNVDVLYVQPNGAGIIYQELSKNYSAIEPPIWAGLLAQHSRKNGFSVAILDCEAERLNPDESAKRILDINPRLVAMVIYGQQPSASTQNMYGASVLCDKLKDSGSSSKIVLIGLHPSASSRETMNSEKADFVCQGEGAYTVDGLLQSDMDNPIHLDKIPGLWYRDNGDIICTRPAPVVPQKELEHELPGMAWDLLPMHLYRTANWHAMSNNNDREPFASLYTSLGCPYQCTFCCINAPFGNNNVENGLQSKSRFRWWDVDFTMGEFQKIHDMGIRNVKIADEMFVLRKDHFLEICKKLKEREFDFNIWAYARIDTVRPEYLDALRDAGVNWLALGIESGNATVRKDVIKGKFTEVNIRDLVQEIRNSGINVIGNYIFGLPEDTADTMKDTLAMANDLNCEFSNFYCTMAYPGSALHIQAKKEGWDLPDSYQAYSQHSYEIKPLATKHITAREVVEFRDNAFNSHYNRPEYHDMIRSKFGQSTVDEIKNMTKIKLKRKILGD
tara:strand:+ start:5891 stop:7405 length:1515 start_codon:yes stop_codon:yes gene_type:complete